MTLKDFRKLKKLNRKEMSQRIGVSASFYHKVEEGYRNPSYNFMIKLKKEFPEVNIDEIFFERKILSVLER